MSLVKCPDCNKNVSSRASQCPFCGCPAEFFEAIIQSDSEKKNEKKDDFTEYVNKPKEPSNPEKDEINIGNEDLTNVEDKSETPMESSGVNKTLQCKQCGAQLDADAAFCNQCGAKVSVLFSEQTKAETMQTDDKFGANEPSKDKEEQTEATSMNHEMGRAQYCNQCGAQLDADAAFCNQCGSAVAPSADESVGANEPSKDNEVKSVENSSYHEVVKALYCNKCGAQLDADSAFCNQCGAPIVQLETGVAEKDSTRPAKNYSKTVHSIFRDNENQNIPSISYKRGKKYCRKCGKELSDYDSDFCNVCNASLSSKLVL